MGSILDTVLLLWQRLCHIFTYESQTPTGTIDAGGKQDPALIQFAAMRSSLPFGFNLDRDYLIDYISRIQYMTPIVCSITVYPANLYLLLVETPKMMREIRVAYLLNLITHVFCDWMFNFATMTYVLPPYGIFYCNGPLCHIGLDKSTVVTLLAIAIMGCIPTYYFLMMRMHQIMVSHTSSKWKLSWRFQLTIYFGLMTASITNVVGFAIFCKDVHNYSALIQKQELKWLKERGGMHVVYSEPGVSSEFEHEIQLFAGSFAIFLPPLMFFVAHALHTLKRSATRAFSNKTQVLTKQLFDIFDCQLRGALIFYVIPLCFVLAAGMIDTRELIPDPVYAFLRFIAVLLFSLNPAQFATVFILRNSTHRTILLKRLRRSKLFALIRRLVGVQSFPKVTITETSGRVRTEFS